MFKTLRTFYAFETKNKWMFLVYILFVATGWVLESTLPYFYKLLIETLPAGVLDDILKLVFIYIGIRFLEIFFSQFSYIFGDKVVVDASIDARTGVFKRIQDLDFAFHSKRSTGSLISAIKRGDGAFFTLHHTLHHRILGTFITFVIMAYFLAQLNIGIALLVICSFLFNILITKFIVAYNINTRRRFNDQEDKISGIIVDNIVNYETVKLFAKESWEQDRLRTAFMPWRREFWSYSNSFRVLEVSVGTLINISIFVILFITLRLFADTQISLGDFVLVLAFISSFFPRLFELVYGFRDIAKSYADIQKYFEVLDLDIKVVDPTHPLKFTKVKGDIKFENVSFKYGERSSHALKKVNLHIREGQSIALIGRSGSGKTTFSKLLMRFFDLNEGSISIDGINIKDVTKANLRSQMGVVPQEPILFNNTLAYNISYGKPGSSRDEIVAAAKIAKIHDFILTLPKKYNTQVGERGMKLSGGQKQRVAIARMILANPRIIIFDEATSHLDSESERLIQEGFWKASHGKTTIVIAHRLSTIMKADKIVVMDKGRVVETGSHQDLIARDTLYKKFWDLQK